MIGVEQALATLRDYVERSTHWREGGATRHEALIVALPALEERFDWLEKGWCDEHKPEVATRCEGCAELRDQLRDLTRQSNLDAKRVGKLAEDVERLREVLYRMLEAPTTQVSASWKRELRQALVCE